MSRLISTFLLAASLHAGTIEATSVPHLFDYAFTESNVMDGAIWIVTQDATDAPQEVWIDPPFVDIGDPPRPAETPEPWTMAMVAGGLAVFLRNRRGASLPN